MVLLLNTVPFTFKSKPGSGYRRKEFYFPTIGNTQSLPANAAA